MARRPGGTGDEVFRVIIERDYGTEILVPYGTISAAKSILTAGTNPPYWNNPSTGYIERATTTYEKVSI